MTRKQLAGVLRDLCGACERLADLLGREGVVLDAVDGQRLAVHLLHALRRVKRLAHELKPERPQGEGRDDA